MSASVSLIVTSYNQPNALGLVLEGVLTQRQPIDELIVADDGSQQDTADLVQAFAERAPCRVEFTTQADRGFRKSRAINQAIRASTGELVLFLDGDCIPPPKWAEHHVDALRVGADFATAGYVLMSLERTQALTPDQIRTGRIDEECTAAERKEFARLHRNERFYGLIRKPKKPRILGGNWSVTRAALYAVNGFDEKFDGFGKEDSDIRNRLRNAGYRGRSLWGHNWVFHCSHDLDPRRNLPEVVRSEPDYEYYESRRRARRCEFGIESPEAAAE